ncbi:hypothetical protein [Nocardia sp. NPDC052566]|uniref:hypothetical protein n=1 Tax=Nocardia sp. NPDC052566 TaxID=3364330 RepID=UPI0037CBC379
MDRIAEANLDRFDTGSARQRPESGARRRERHNLEYLADTNPGRYSTGPVAGPPVADRLGRPSTPARRHTTDQDN